MTETQERKMKTKLYTVDINGVEHEVKTTCAVLTPEREYPSQEQFVRALKGLQSVSVECEVTIPDDVAAVLRVKNQKWQQIKSAMWKLRKSCCLCRWMVVERDNKKRPYTHHYCKYNRNAEVFTPFDSYAVYCKHFKRKAKSKP